MVPTLVHSKIFTKVFHRDQSVLFNVFLNDIFNFVKENKQYNYADDNTLSHWGPNLSGLVKSLEKESAILIDWFANNKMKANPDKYQAISIGNK